MLWNAIIKMNGKTKSDPTDVKTIVTVMVIEFVINKDGVKVQLDQKTPNVKILMKETTSPMIIPTTKNVIMSLFGKNVTMKETNSNSKTPKTA